MNGPPALRRLLVATDFSAAARMAVLRAGQLARQHGARLHVVHAQPDWNLFCAAGSASAAHYRALDEHSQAAMREELAFLSATFGIQAQGETRVGRASAVLRSAIADFQPQIVVVAAHGEHADAALAPFLGGTALKLIAFAEVPVLVVRRPGPDGYRSGLAAIERSGGTARQILGWAQTLLAGGDCHVVHAYDLPYVQRLRSRGVAGEAVESCLAEVRATAQRFVDEVLRELPASGLRVHAHLVCGEAVSAVMGEIHRCKPELLLIGKHEHPPREQRPAALGSVALRIAYHATSDVLVIP